MSVTSDPERVLAIRRSETENSTMVIYPRHHISGVNPIYFARLHAFNQPFLELYHWPNIENVVVGEARSSSSTSETRLTISGQQYTLTADPRNKSYGLEGSDQGELRWMEGIHPTYMSLELIDHTGWPLAGLKARHCNCSRMRLELYVQCTEQFVALMLLSGLVVADSIARRPPRPRRRANMDAAQYMGHV